MLGNNLYTSWRPGTCHENYISKRLVCWLVCCFRRTHQQENKKNYSNNKWLGPRTTQILISSMLLHKTLSLFLSCLFCNSNAFYPQTQIGTESFPRAVVSQPTQNTLTFKLLIDFFLLTMLSFTTNNTFNSFCFVLIHFYPIQPRHVISTWFVPFFSNLILKFPS